MLSNFAYMYGGVEGLRRLGDEEYAASDGRHVSLFGQRKFVGGPTGPAGKQLDQEDVSG